MLELLGKIKNKKLLDLGCGFGYYGKIYSENGLGHDLGNIWSG